MFNKNVLDYKYLNTHSKNIDYKSNIDYSKLVRKELSNYFYNDSSYMHYFYTTSSARSSLNIIINSIEFDKESEVIVLGHTCSEIPNVLISNNLNPVYVDINIEQLCFTYNDVINKINPKTKAIIIQHHLGFINYDSKLISFLKDNSIIIIEDCALALGSKCADIIAGKIGDFSIFSFGKSKTFNAYIGGCILVNNKKFLNSVELTYKKLYKVNKLQLSVYKFFYYFESITYNSTSYYFLYYILVFLKIFTKIIKLNYHIPTTNIKSNKQMFDFILPNYFNFLIYLNIYDLKTKINYKVDKLNKIIDFLHKKHIDIFLHKLYFNKHLTVCTNRIVFIDRNNFNTVLYIIIKQSRGCLRYQAAMWRARGRSWSGWDSRSRHHLYNNTI